MNGHEAFAHYWQYLAADINKDKMVDSRDLLELENLIALKSTGNWLVINHNKPLNNQNWSSYITEYVVDKWNEEEEIKINFTAILIGDIDGSSASLDVVQYETNYKLEDNDETTWRSTLSSNTEAFKVYPNPFSDHFTIECTKTQDEVVKLTLYDISGKVGHIKELHCYKGKNSFTIDDPFLESSGIKMIRLESISGVQHIKVVKTTTHP